MRALFAMVPRRALPVLATATHGQAARLAQLRVLRVHAGRNLRDVRNEFGAQSHRVGRTGLPFGIGTLRIRAVETINQYAGQQQQPANQTSDPH